MAKQPPQTEIIEEGAPEWVVTFGDLMSLLLCFFVLLLTFSEMDKSKYKMMTGSMKEAFGVQKKRNVMGILKGTKIIARDFDQEPINLKLEDTLANEIHQEVGTYLEEMKDLVNVVVNRRHIVIKLMGETAFDSGKAEIRRQMAPVLRKIGELLTETTGEIVICGHTDNVPIHSDKYASNLILSMARAASVANFLIKETKVDPKRIATMGFGEHQPIDTNETEAGRRRNRRVEITVSSHPFGRQPIPYEEASKDNSAADTESAPAAAENERVVPIPELRLPQNATP